MIIWVLLDNFIKAENIQETIETLGLFALHYIKN